MQHCTNCHQDYYYSPSGTAAPHSCSSNNNTYKSCYRCQNTSYKCDRGCCVMDKNGQGYGGTHSAPESISTSQGETTTLKIQRTPLYLCHVCRGAYANFLKTGVRNPYCFTCGDRGWIV